MKLHILGSSSHGNGYVLETSDEALMLEAGIAMQKVKKVLGFQLRKLKGCVVTHEHNDHARYVAEVSRSGIVVLALKEVFLTHGIDGAIFTMAVEPKRAYRLGNFLCQPIEVKHDCPAVGWIISHPEIGKLLFVTDTVGLDYIIPSLNCIMIEANYADDIVNERIDNGELNPAMRSRLLASHMELEQTKRILREHDLSGVGAIVLVHLSDGNADEQRFVAEVAATTGVPTYAARPGMTIDITNHPY